MNKILVLLFTSTISFSVAAAKLPMSFEEAAKVATNTKGCNKKSIGKIYMAQVMPPIPGAPKGIYIEVLPGEEAPNSNLVGPLASKPTQAQLDSLKGKSMCEPAE